jgi:non-homologous end joining protein Ku
VRAFTRAIEKLAKPKLATQELEDATAERVRELAERKHKRGQDVVEGVAPQALAANAEVIDMMEVLKQSLQRHEASKPANTAHSGKRKARTKTKSARH